MTRFVLTKERARLFILIKQGLIGDYKFSGKPGVLEFIKQAGCVQYDPIDVCGKNSELVLQARVKDFTKEMLYELLYQDRLLVDYFDKNLAIINIDDWKCFERIRNAYRNRGRSRSEIDCITDRLKEMIAEKGPVCSKDIGYNEKVDWYWSSTKLSRAALETLYFRGELVIHHKKGTIKYYALAKDYIPESILNDKDPHEEELDYLKWRVERRISAVGLLWNRPSDAWLAIDNLKAKSRNIVFEKLLEDNRIVEVEVQGVKGKLYCLNQDIGIIDQVQGDIEYKERTELIAALDSFLWDRKLINEIFDFDYKWEIYTPIDKRKYGYYVLPILKGQSFVGRTEVVCDRKSNTLIVKNLWLEKEVHLSSEVKISLMECYERFKNFHRMNKISYDFSI